MRLTGLSLQVDKMISPLDPIPAYFFPYEVPVTPNAFSILAVVCSILGLVLFGWFFTLQVTKGESTGQHGWPPPPFDWLARRITLLSTILPDF